MVAQEIPLGSFLMKLSGRSSVAEGTMAFHFAKPDSIRPKPIYAYSRL